MPTVPSTLCFRKITHLGLTPQAINFAKSSFMGHRVCFNVPVDLMNQYFEWTRAAGELRPTGRFLNNPNPLGLVPTFEQIIERCLGTDYTDLDGVAQGLNYSSDALDTLNDTKRDTSITNNTWDYTNLGLTTPSAPTSTPETTHYSANDLVMAFVLNKCFGSSSFDAWDIVYNLEDAFGMLTSADLAAAIKDSLQDEEDKAAAMVAPNKAVNLQQPGDDKGRVDEMFRSLLATDPQRFYKGGVQIPGLFETNVDADGDGNWCFGIGDKIEIPVRLYFCAPVTVLSVVDNAKNPSSATPDQVETVFIKGEASNFDATDAAQVAAADRGNVMSLRLQLVCSAPVISNKTLATSEDITVPITLQVVNKMSLIFYKGPHYPTQTSIGIVVAGGVGPYGYEFTIGGTVQQNVVGATPSDGPPGITLSATGIFSFNPAGTNATAGRWLVGVSVTDANGTIVNTTIYITVDELAGSSGPPPSGLTMPAVESINNSAGLSGTGPYSISGYTQSMVNLGSSDTIHFDSNGTITGTWLITAAVTSAGSRTTPTIPTTPNNNTVSYNPSTGSISLSSGDPLYPPGSAVVFTAVCTRTSDGAVGTTLLNVTMPLTEIVPTLVTPDNSVTENLSQVVSDGIYTYNVGDNAAVFVSSQYITVVAVPAAAAYSIVVAPLQGAGQATWNVVSSQIDITTNSNFGVGAGTIGKGFTFTYEDVTGTKMPLGINTGNSGNNELIVNVIDNYQ